MNNTIYALRKYKETKADINYIDIQLEEIDSNMLGVSAQPTGERTCNTYKITSTVETQAESHMEEVDSLKKERDRKEREIRRVDNALSMLREEEKDILTTIYIEKERWWKLEERHHKSQSQLQNLGAKAIKQIDKYFN